MSGDTNEPLADVLAEMKRENRPYGISPERLHHYADRIEAAAERERAEIRRDAEIEWTRIGYDERKAEEKRAPGNAAAMREALEEQLRYWNSHVRTRDEEEMRKRTEAALAAPARNCDVGTAEEQAKRFRSFCDTYNRCGSCPLDFTDDIAACPIEWAQMPFAPAKGGAKC